uniref:Uncharacterized protein n=1 Tax=Brassica oleracea var. oleracea TaxID=109376 RepID=A0A0D3DLB0_BRAOL
MWLSARAGTASRVAQPARSSSFLLLDISTRNRDSNYKELSPTQEQQQQESNTKLQNQQQPNDLSSQGFRQPETNPTVQIQDKPVSNTSAKFQLNQRRSHCRIYQTLKTELLKNCDDQLHPPLSSPIQSSSQDLSNSPSVVTGSISPSLLKSGSHHYQDLASSSLSSSLIAYSILISGSLKLAVCRHRFNLTISAQVRKPPLPRPRLLLFEENFDIAEMCHRCYEPEVEAEADAVQNKMAEARGGGGAKLLKTAVFRRL